MTIAMHLEAGNFSYITASDTQVTYEGISAKVDSGKIRGAFRSNPSGAINITGAGWDSYATAVSQEIVDMFQKFRGSPDQLEKRVRTLVRDFYKEQVLPFVGKLDDDHVPDYSLLIAARHKQVTKLWNVDGMLLKKSEPPFDCIGIGDSVATALLNTLYPRYPTLDSVAVLAAYVIYRVKSSVEACGLKTEIRFILQDKIGLVPFDRIERWEALFQKYDRLEREVLYHAMNFVMRRPALPLVIQKAMEKSGHHYDHEKDVPPQMKPLPEIVKEIEAMRAEFSRLTIF
jgi:hypothetical protein